jgi:hypothetical protein
MGFINCNVGYSVHLTNSQEIKAIVASRDDTIIAFDERDPSMNNKY